ncbi:MAG: LacI family DNA-binding transcriptional regulator [Acidobacteria bacterium]|nr:LacI family DNA-binding transcriptional regulator [Acidobacteriota bacterium]
MPTKDKNKAIESNGSLIDSSQQKNISLKDVAASLKLSPTTVSVVLNYSPLADSIPQETKNRIFEAARNLNYRPNYIARSLRNQRTHTIGVLIPEMSEGYSAAVLSGVEEKLLQKGYFYFVASHHHREDLIERNTQFLVARCVEGILAIDTPIQQSFLPIVSISGHDRIKGVTNIVLNHERAAYLAVEHLYNLGHRRIAVIKGQEFSSDTEVRLATMIEAARNFGIDIDQSRITQLIGDDPSPETGYLATRELLSRGAGFTAVLAFNDISAIGAIRAIREKGFEVPKDVSIIGFDDITAAEFHHPALTTIRQPLKKMGSLGAEHLLQNIQRNPTDAMSIEITVEPELIVRASTAAVPAES